MGANNSVLLPPDQVQLICEETGKFIHLIFSIKRILGFTPDQVQRLYTRFQELDKRKPPLGYLTREDLLAIRKIALNPLGERVVDVIIEDFGSIIFKISYLIKYFYYS
jgi:Ca2+-binding EF-hand superfamily protein